MNVAQSRYDHAVDLAALNGRPLNSFMGTARYTFGLIVFLNCALILLNLLVADLTPPVTSDEVMFTDPAVNLAWGYGFRTTAWYTQPYASVFASNAPLYSLLLAGWIKLLGFNFTLVRSLNYVLMAASAIVIWGNLRRIQPRPSFAASVGLVLLLWLGEGISLAYRMGRYDMLGVLVLALTWSALLIQSTPRRTIALFVLGMLIPASGYHLILYVVLCTLVLPFTTLPHAMRSFVVVSCGIGCGLLSVAYFYHLVGSLDVMFNTLVHHGDHFTAAGHRQKPILKALRVDLSSLVLMAALGLLAGIKIRQRSVVSARLELTGLYFLLVMPLVFGVLRIAQDYYAWMKYIPACICLVLALERFHTYRLPPPLQRCALLFPLIAILGFPARLALAARDAAGFRHAPLAEFVQQIIRPGDWALISAEAYYPARPRVERVFTSNYLPFLTAAERQRISIIICNPQDRARLLEEFNSGFHALSGYDPLQLANGSGHRRLGWPPYQLQAYRRVGSITAPTEEPAESGGSSAVLFTPIKP